MKAQVLVIRIAGEPRGPGPFLMELQVFVLQMIAYFIQGMSVGFGDDAEALFEKIL